MTTKMYLLLLSVALVVAEENDIRAFTSGSTLFTADVYNELLLENKDNFLVSPFSVEAILALTQTGAVGETGQEIRNKLYLPESEDETESLMKRVLPTIVSDQYSLKTANKIYVENNFAIKEQFKTAVTNVYQAQFQNIEFAQSFQAAAEINHWVEEQTNDKIHDLINPDDLDESTTLVLINALYFQGNWTKSFAPVPSKLQFYTSEKKSADVDALFQKVAQYNYYESEALDATFLELPFNGEGASMTIVLPNKNEGIAVLEKQFSSVLVTPQYTQQYVQVLLPKFKIETTINFLQVLQKLGIKKAFDPLQADFSGIAGAKGDLVVDGVVQKTYISVNEWGVEAAAATGVVVGTTAVIQDPIPTKTFIADHPFIFFIKVNDVVLFEGRVLVPQF